MEWSVKQIDFPDKWAAIVWMCRNQLGRRNITPQQRAYIIKEEYDAQVKTHGGDRGSQHGEDGRFSASEGNLHLRDKKNKTRNIVADAHGIGLYEVQSAVEFGRGLDAAEKVSPGIKDAVLSGEVKAPKKIIAEIRNLPKEKQKETAEATGEELPVFVTRAVETQAQRDALSRRMKGGKANE